MFHKTTTVKNEFNSMSVTLPNTNDGQPTNQYSIQKYYVFPTGANRWLLGGSYHSIEVQSVYSKALTERGAHSYSLV